jgi:hypothetical protein
MSMVWDVSIDITYTRSKMLSSLTFLYGRPTAPQWQNKELIPDGQIFGRKVLIEKGYTIFSVLVNFKLPLVYKSCMEIRFYRLN